MKSNQVFTGFILLRFHCKYDRKKTSSLAGSFLIFVNSLVTKSYKKFKENWDITKKKKQINQLVM